MAVAIVVRRSTPLHWLHRLHHPKPARSPRAPRIAQPPMTYAANADRWVTLPDEYDDCAPSPVYATVSPMHGPGVSAPIACAVDGPTVLHLGGVWRGQVAFEGSTDGRFWRPIPLLPIAGDASDREEARPGIWRTAPHASVRFLRVRVLSLTAGTIVPAVAHIQGTGAQADCMDTAA